jgi:PKD repeat protein
MKLKTLVLLVAGVLVGAFVWFDAPPALAQTLVNDFFNSPLVVGSIPYSRNVDTTSATMEPGEPLPTCAFASSGGTVWFSYTPPTNEFVAANTFGPDSSIGVYTGSSVDALSQVDCRTFGWENFVLSLTGGTTYHFQIAPLFFGGLTNFTLNPPPPLQVGFDYSPFDPSTFDTVFFNAFVFGGLEFPNSFSWEFGDGETGEGQFVNHNYAADGDYLVQLTASTEGGESATAERTVSVRTRDVAIVKISAPNSGKVGQTRQVTVQVKSTRYDEMVMVELFRSVPGGEVFVGVQNQMVFVRSGNRGTEFPFNYTFTADDAALGKVSFRAQATIQGRDALPADNTAISSPPTKVSGGGGKAKTSSAEEMTEGENILFLPALNGSE